MTTGRLARTIMFTVTATAMISHAAPSRAEGPVTPRNPASAVANSVAGTGATRFDWLAKRKTGTKVRAVRRASLGNGSWVCSPAGFGSKSRCYRR